jgi:hypothetical protein
MQELDVQRKKCFFLKEQLNNETHNFREMAESINSEKGGIEKELREELKIVQKSNSQFKY